MTNLDKVATSHICKFQGVLVCFLTLRKNAENANKSYHVYKVIVMLHVCNKILGIRLTGYPANRN